MTLIRFWVGRHLIHLGLWVMPPGRVKEDLEELLWDWHDHVVDVVNAPRKKEAADG